MKILINFPVRNRVAQFEKTIQSLVKCIEDWTNIILLLKVDDDDDNKDKFVEIANKYIDSENLTIDYGISINKVHAQTRNIEKYDWDIVVNWSDDVYAIYPGIEKEIRKPFDEHGLDWCPCFKDIYRTDQLPTLAIIGREYFDRFGYMLNPQYESLYSDNEMECVAKLLGKFEFIENPIIFRHDHPNNTGQPRDEMYEMNESSYYYQKDGTLFQERKFRNFDLKL
jgi:hypothetical protein